MSFAIIHITDIHIENDQDQVLARSAEIIRVCNDQLSNVDDAVLVVTGDLANKGAAEQYNICCEFLIKIAKSIKVKSGRLVEIVAVPGNHDCDFTDAHVRKIRSFLLDRINRNDVDGFDHDLVVEAMNPQRNYFDITPEIHSIKDDCPIAKYLQMNLGGRNVCFQLFNTAWISELQEQPGRLCMPINLIPDNTITRADLYVSLAHHPLHWLNADNMVAFRNVLRKSSDIVLWGHEHLNDSITQKGDAWNLVSLEGRELQDRKNPQNSAFSLYIINNEMDNLQRVILSWEGQSYVPVSGKSFPLERNAAQSLHSLYPNKETLEELNDYGALIHHPHKEQIALDDLFVWPLMLKVDPTNINNGLRVDSEEEIEHFTESDITIIVGDEDTGKTTLAKKIYRRYLERDKCCIFIKGQDITARSKNNIEIQIDSAFCDQYDQASKEQFKTLKPEDRVLLIDDFDGLVQNNRKYGEVIQTVKGMFGTVILLTGVDANISYIITQLNAACHTSVIAYRIRHLGNAKRNEIIEKWYSLGAASLDKEAPTKDQRVAIATETVNNFIEKFSKIAPATPLLVVSVLQTIDGTGKSNLTQYSYMYEQLVLRSLVFVSRNDQALQNIFVGILSNMAYRMLQAKSRYINADDLIRVVTDYKDEMLLQFNPIDIIQHLINSAILVAMDESRFRFKYPYLYYYFAGLYISRHIVIPEIKELVDHLSAHLYVEDYGNIMIFVCHFTNDEYVIDSVLTCALCALDQYEEFDYSKPDKLLSSINESIEQQVPMLLVGNETDVDIQHKHQLETMDSEGIHDGTLTPISEGRIDDSPMEVADIVSAIRIIDVIGQILKNYPGEINRDQKLDMISGISDLAMRVVSLMYTAIGSTQEDFIQLLTNVIREAEPDISQSQILATVKTMFASLVFGTSCSMIHSVCRAIGSRVLIPAIGAAKEKYENNVALKLIYAETGLITFDNSGYDELIRLSKELKQKKLYYAYQTMRILVARHLRFNHCGVDYRNRLCDAYNLSKTSSVQVLPE